MGADDQRDHPGPGRPAHASHPIGRPGRVAAWVGAAAGVTAVGLGTAALVHPPHQAASGPPSLQAITVASAPAAVLPLAPAEIWALQDRRADLGALADPHRLGSCLAGLGYPGSARVLGAQPIRVGGRAAVLLVLPGEQAGTVTALAVAPGCSSADTGLLADTVVPRP